MENGEKSNYTYYGQVDNRGQREGFGRVCIHGSMIKEGIFKNNKLNGYARVIYDSRVTKYYEG